MGFDDNEDLSAFDSLDKNKSYRHNLPNIAQAKALSLDKAMTEAIVSLNLLKSEIMDGNERKISDIFSNSLPLVSKDHIFDGLNTNFIQQDILNTKKVKTTAFKICETSAKKDRDRFKTSNARTQRFDSISCNENLLNSKLSQSLDKESYKKKFRDYEKDQQFRAALVQLRRYPAPMKPHSICQPHSYNSFITSGVQDIENQDSGLPNSNLVISSVKLSPNEAAVERDFKPVAGLPLLQIQIDRVKELVGRREKTSVRHETAKNAERKLTSRRSRVSVTGSELIERWDREGTSLFPSPVVTPKSRRSDYSRPLTTPWDGSRISPRVKNILSPSNLIF